MIAKVIEECTASGVKLKPDQLIELSDKDFSTLSAIGKVIDPALEKPEQEAEKSNDD